MSSAIQSSAATSSALAISGERLSGISVREFNSKAAQTLANLLKSSLGPLGLDKMLIDSKGEQVNISNDGATILSLLDVGHPAAKILVELARQQDEDVGDGTTSVVILAAELIKRATELIKRQRLHPTTVIAGFRLACKEAVRYVEDQLSYESQALGKTALLNCARTALSSKVIGNEHYGDFFAQLAVDAVLGSDPSSHDCEDINMLKAHGQSPLDSQLLANGFALNCTVASEGLPKHVSPARIACLDLNLQRNRMHQGATVLITDPTKLEDVRQREVGITVERIRTILKSGANVVLTTKGIDDLSLKMFVEAGAMAVRRVKSEDLRRIAKMSGASVVSTLANLEGEESFDPQMLGHAELVSQERFGDDECIIIKGTAKKEGTSIILRGSNDQMLDEMERSMHDALCVLKRVIQTKRVVAGGGVVETALSVFLENLATTIASKEQLAVAEYGEALLVIPKTLALNAGLDGPELVAKLRAGHYAAQSALSVDDPRQQTLKNSGLDLNKGTVQDCVQAGVLEPSMVKVKALNSATEAAVAILRIDDFIKVIEPPKQHGDEND